MTAPSQTPWLSCQWVAVLLLMLLVLLLGTTNLLSSAAVMWEQPADPAVWSPPVTNSISQKSTHKAPSYIPQVEGNKGEGEVTSDSLLRCSFWTRYFWRNETGKWPSLQQIKRKKMELIIQKIFFHNKLQEASLQKGEASLQKGEASSYYSCLTPLHHVIVNSCFK